MIQPATIGTIAVRARGGASYPLAAYTTGLWGTYSIKKLLATASSSLRVRRSSDNAEQDIGFTGSALDTAALATFVGANSAYVTTFYDQTGNGRHLVQTTSSKQPRIVSAGTYDGLLYFDGTDDAFTSNTASGTPTGISLFMRGQVRSSASTYVYVETTTDGVINAGVLIYTAASVPTTVYAGTYTNRVGMNYANALNGVHGYRVDRSQALKANQASLFVGGANNSPSATDHGAGTTDAAFVSAVWNIGARNNGTSLATPLNLDTLLIYTVANSNADMTSISGIV